MPITASAKKALRNSARKHVFNLRRARAMRSLIKKTQETAPTGKAGESTALLAQAYKAIDKAAKHGTIAKNTAARKKSRLARALNSRVS